jgi:NADH dehydrogenase
MACLTERRTQSQVYELGGPHVYSYQELMELILRETGRRSLLVPVPFWLAKLPAYFLEYLPNPPLTRDQLTLLRSDNTETGTLGTLKTLGIRPTAAAAILPTYLDRFRRGGRFNRAQLA